ncbi:hypothetical protein CIB84_002915 [Bambusicola thoracicus]|uniref:Uncharacterized protein n=1 Tax=Bambusicola thoracicus TaxID=9083 RepID=A0A2P4TAE6_BAMTH|nr:hypothetical protein CIB84_002915 [Bambusicola thoracicus]
METSLIHVFFISLKAQGEQNNSSASSNMGSCTFGPLVADGRDGGEKEIVYKLDPNQVDFHLHIIMATLTQVVGEAMDEDL